MKICDVCMAQGRVNPTQGAWWGHTGDAKLDLCTDHYKRTRQLKPNKQATRDIKSLAETNALKVEPLPQEDTTP